MRTTRCGLVLPVADYAGCVAFYRDCLELPVLFAFDRPGSTLTGFDLGGAYLLVEPEGRAKTPETFPDDAQAPTMLRSGCASTSPTWTPRSKRCRPRA